ncbi:alkaline phosphatase family protein [Natronolimnohabitans innermongolicus]|uniref:Type I phosphodiesterase/nucleotide pyrophosphatase n=1 Tax=Natronolimnohabitans innermongolicus JCM 12255 TaxID=1227499 RepID=L9XIR4_9EURY|nr:alkaline phosphatase family protein [Natronolimnohabitans innermongolicus]ELY61639.1 type I phosphodiesterase/nucleotide pyrophosphatase [Natronolimnohabitans innermongolicus JCM 12255]
MRTDLEARLRDRQTEDGYLFPDYADYCFANVPGTIGGVLGAEDVSRRSLPPDVLEGVGDDYDRVLAVVVDGFGLAFWKRHGREHPLLERLETAGTVSPLTATYPSETAAAMTTFHTGRLPASHGAIGWDIYDPIDDASYEAFTGNVKAGDESVDRELQDVFAGEPIYPALEATGIDCHHVVPFAETYDGAVAHTYRWNRDDGGPGNGAADGGDSGNHHEPGRDHEIEGFADALEKAFADADDPAYLYAYLPQIDAAAHAAGTESAAYRETVRTTIDTLERALGRLESRDGADDTLLVVTADHGHVNTTPETNVDLERCDELMIRLDHHATGEPVRYAGSPRNLHLHLREPERTRDHARAFLAERLDARIFTREDALERDLFGDGPTSETFRRRLGDLIVCHRDRSVWFGSDRAHLELVGVHGGLHPDEMLVPFAAAELGAALE